MRYYGEVAELAGCTEENMEYQHNTTAETAVNIVRDRYPAIQKLQLTLAVNNGLTNGKHSLSDGDTIDLFPPFSGG
jgi:molybdopterin converting factor small subunit